MSGCVHIHNKKKITQSLVTKGLGDTISTAKFEYSINFTGHKQNFFNSTLNGRNSYLLVNGLKIYDFKANNSELFANPLCSGNISKDFSVPNMKETGLNGYVYDFSVDYFDISFNNITDIHEYLMKKKKTNKQKM